MKTITITLDKENINMKNEGFDTFEMLGILYFLEQQIKVQLLQAQRMEDLGNK